MEKAGAGFIICRTLTISSTCIAIIHISCSQFSSHQQSFSSSTLEVTVRGTKPPDVSGGFLFAKITLLKEHNFIHQAKNIRSSPPTPGKNDAGHSPLPQGIIKYTILEILVTYLSVLLFIRHLNIVCYEKDSPLRHGNAVGSMAVLHQ
ncbi:hypothetical protein [Longitalea arenae]|uniref:hypothetical protein n=1 Tax=Longitalea arenae TaxID=2812558 RepID=UPI001967E1C0|nr:hypothetical protein [Longitalea arenae]